MENSEEKTKLCKKCKTPIHADAVECPHCQADLRDWISKHPLATTLLLIFVVMPVILGLGGSSSSTSSSSTNISETAVNKQEQVKATIRFTGSTFVITNANDFDWKSTKITINEKYSYDTNQIMEAGSTYEIGAGQFTDRDQTRFNPFVIKPSEIRIYVREPLSEDWYGNLN